MSRTTRPLAALLCGLAGACAAGPEFARPTPPATSAFVPGRPPGRTASAPGTVGAAQYFLPGQEVPQGWWGWFGSAELDALIAQAFAGSPTLAAARARLRGAEATLAARRALRSPELVAVGQGSYGNRGGGGQNNAGGGGTGTGATDGTTPTTPPAPGNGTGATDGTGGTTGTGGTAGTGGNNNNAGGGQQGFGGRAFTVYTATATVRYDLDIAGRNRRLIEAAAAETERQRQELQAAYLALVGNIVSTAFEQATLAVQIATREELITAQKKRIELIRILVTEGRNARADLVIAQAEVAALRATLPPLRARLAAAGHALAELTGRPPAEGAPPPIRLTGLRLPRALPISLPTRLVRTRPDILASEALVAAASAQVGVAAADLYPNLGIDASYGIGGFSGTLIDFFNLGGQLLAPLFDGGRRRAERDVAVAAYEEALANYRARVLAAFTEVANGIRALEGDAATLREQAAAVAASGESLELAVLRAREGAISQIDVFFVQRTYQDARFAYVDAVGQRLQDTAALFAAVGPGPLTQDALASVTLGDPLRATLAAMETGEPPATVVTR